MSKYDSLVMVTRLTSGESFVSVLIPASEHQFVVAFPMSFDRSGVTAPWFDFTSNRIFPFSPNDLTFCKCPSEWLLSDYLTELFMHHPEAIDFMDDALSKDDVEHQPTIQQTLH